MLNSYSLAGKAYLSTACMLHPCPGRDSAGVTTGPVTVPFVLAIGIGFSKAVGSGEGAKCLWPRGNNKQRCKCPRVGLPQQ